MLRMRAAMGPAAMSSSPSVETRPGVAIVAPETRHGLAGAGEGGGECLDGRGVGAHRRLKAGPAGDEGQMDDAVAVEGAGAQHVGVGKVAAQDIGTHVGDSRG
jgi:hypothetical protein